MGRSPGWPEGMYSLLAGFMEPGETGEAETSEITIDPKEIEDARWFTREEVFEATHRENLALKPARKGSIAHFLIHNWLSDTLD